MTADTTIYNKIFKTSKTKFIKVYYIISLGTVGKKSRSIYRTLHEDAKRNPSTDLNMNKPTRFYGINKI